MDLEIYDPSWNFIWHPLNRYEDLFMSCHTSFVRSIFWKGIFRVTEFHHSSWWTLGLYRWLYFKSLMISHLEGLPWMTICIILHTYFTKWQYYDIIHWQSFNRHEIQKKSEDHSHHPYKHFVLPTVSMSFFWEIWIWTNSGSAYIQFVFFLINRLNPRRVFAVSSWILSIDSGCFSRLRTILFKHVMKYCTRIMSSEFVQLRI